MNKELKGRVFNLPQIVLDKINHSIKGLGGQHSVGANRAQKLLNDRTVTYGQLKRIIHDFQNLDKVKDKIQYDLYGGEVMERWAKQYLQGERDLISNRKDSRQRADNIGGINGERENSHLKSHSKKPDWLPPTNLVKSNSHKTSVSSLKMGKLFEEVDRIKKLMI